MKLKELSQLLKSAALEGAANAVLRTNELTEYYNKAQAYRLYGRSDVDRWIAEGILIPAKRNGKVSKKCISRVKLENVAFSSNRVTYLPVAER